MADLPAWWGDKPAKVRQNRRSGAAERRVAREVGGRTMPGSGSSWRAAGDVSSESHLLEHKFTDKRSFSLKVADWAAIRRKAERAGKDPGMIIEFPEQGIRLLITEYEA